MLADRSFRTMAATTTLFAFIMVVICLVHSSELANRANKSSTSVGGKAYVVSCNAPQDFAAPKMTIFPDYTILPYHSYLDADLPVTRNQTCESMEGKNVVIHLVINIAYVRKKINRKIFQLLNN